MTTRDELFMENEPNRIIPGFPYAERECKYCFRPLKIWRAMHIFGEEEHYKAVMVCDRSDCTAYDEETKEAYVRVYFSSPYAHEKLSAVLAWNDPRALYPEQLRKT
jgi:hypothetical protein